MGKSLSDQRLVPTRGTRCVTNSMKDEKIKNKKNQEKKGFLQTKVKNV
jgi:hypothetical protein